MSFFFSIFMCMWLNQYSETAVVPRASILATEVEWLNSIKADLVVTRCFVPYEPYLDFPFRLF